MRFTSVLIWIIAALLIACSADSTSPPPQVGNETSTDARPSVAATATELPTAMPAAELTPDQSVPPATMGPTNPPTTTEAPKAQPETETAPTATPQEPTATAPPTETPTPEPHLPTPHSDRAAGTADSDTDRYRNNSARDRVSSPSHAAGLRPP